MIPAATPTFKDSVELGLLAKLGIVSRRSTSSPTSKDMPFPSFPMTINPVGPRVVVLMFSPDKTVR